VESLVASIRSDGHNKTRVDADISQNTSDANPNCPSSGQDDGRF
jgi:hypothetical protein